MGLPREGKRSYLLHSTPEFGSRGFLGLTVTWNEIRIAATCFRCAVCPVTPAPIATSPAKAIAAVVMEKGKTIPDKSFGRFRAEITCPLCKGSGACPTCGGTGEIETGGESG